MLGAVVNTMAVLVGGGIGLLCKKGIPDRVADAVMKILGAFVLCLGITGIFEGENSLVLLVSIVLGTIIGEVLNVDAGITRLGTLLAKKVMPLPVVLLKALWQPRCCSVLVQWVSWVRFRREQRVIRQHFLQSLCWMLWRR